MTRTEALAAVLIGFGLAVWGLTWALGPWALVGCGGVLIVVALLIPERERRGEPVDEPAPAPD